MTQRIGSFFSWLFAFLIPSFLQSSSGPERNIGLERLIELHRVALNIRALHVIRVFDRRDWGSCLMAVAGRDEYFQNQGFKHHYDFDTPSQIFNYLGSFFGISYLVTKYLFTVEKSIGPISLNGMLSYWDEVITANTGEGGIKLAQLRCEVVVNLKQAYSKETEFNYVFNVLWNNFTTDIDMLNRSRILLQDRQAIKIPTAA